MASLRPVSFYGLEVPPNDEPVLAFEDFPATIRITMAAIDPFAKSVPEIVQDSQPFITGATLRIIRVPVPDYNDEDEDEEDDEYEDDEDEDEDGDFAALLNDVDSNEDEDDEEDVDSAKKSKAEKKALLKKLANGEDHGKNFEKNSTTPEKTTNKVLEKVNGIQQHEEEDDDEEESEYSDDMDGEAEVYVLCSLDAAKAYQQPLDITINPHETVMFSATGTHSVYLTGNIVIDEDEHLNFDSDSEDEYDLSPDPDELDMDMLDQDDEEEEEDDDDDELDDLEDPSGLSRITELEDEDEDEDDEMPDLVEQKSKSKAKGKNKRLAEDEDEDDEEEEDGKKQTLDELINKTLKAQTVSTTDASKSADDVPVGADGKPLSKNQLKKLKKKLKNNAGEAVVPSAGTGQQEDVGTKTEPSLATKKVQFAENLVTGPSSKATTNGESAKASLAEKDNAAKKASLGVKTVQGVTVDDRKLGTGPAAKSGDKVSMRYIGKLQKDKKVFDSNKKGKPFQFTLGKGEVIRGWDIGVAGMSAGGERRLTIPANLAYGSKGAGKEIPPNSVLEFDVKLLEIK